MKSPPSRRLAPIVLAAAFLGMSTGSCLDVSAQTVAWMDAKNHQFVDGDAQPGENLSVPLSTGQKVIGVDAVGNVYIAATVDNGTNDDLLTLSLDATGNLRWSQVKDQSGRQTVYGMAVSTDGKVAVTGLVGQYDQYDISTVLYDHDGNELWERRKSVSSGNDFSKNVAIGPNGNVYVVATAGTSQNTDLVTVAYDSRGNELWTRVKNQNALDSANHVAVTAGGLIYVSGSTGASQNSLDAMLVVYDSQGAEIRTTIKALANSQHVMDLVLDEDGRAFLFGFTIQGATRQTLVVALDAAGLELFTHEGGNGWYTAGARGPNGNLYAAGFNATNRWLAAAHDGTTGAALWGRERTGIAYDVAVGPQGHLYVTGASALGSTGTDYVTVAYDAAGTEQWVQTKDGAAHLHDEGIGVAVNAAGTVFVTGSSTRLVIPADPDEAALPDEDDVLTVAYSPAGQELWAQKEPPLRGSRELFGGKNSLAVDASGNVFVTGSSNPTRYDSDPASENPADVDFLTLSYDSEGQQRWAKVKAQPLARHDSPVAIAIGPNGRVYVTGISGAGALTVAYDNDGNELWSQLKEISGWQVQPFDLAVDSDSRVYVFANVANGASQPLIFAYDGSGSEMWAQVATGVPNTAWAYAGALDAAQDRLLLTGTSAAEAATSDFLTVAWDRSGNQLWSRTYSGPGTGKEIATAMAVDASGRVFVSGSMETAPQSNQTQFQTVAYQAELGTELWHQVPAAPSNFSESVRAAEVAPNGDLIVTGLSRQGSFDLDVLTLAYAAADGMERWVRRKDPGTAPLDGLEPRALAISPEGKVLISGVQGSVWTGNILHGDVFGLAYDATGRELWWLRLAGERVDQASAIVVDRSGAYLAGSSETFGPDLLTLKVTYPLFEDGFESGDESAWAHSAPGGPF